MLVAPGGVIAVTRRQPYWLKGTLNIPVIMRLVNHSERSEAMLTMTLPYCGWYS